MKIKAFSVMVAGLATVLMTGCQTGGSGSAYMQPEIEGRVVDAVSGEPIRNVVIIRDPRPSKPEDPTYMSSGEALDKQNTIYTDKRGEFEVNARRAEYDGDNLVWTSVTLKFLHPQYHMYSTNFAFAAEGDEEPELEIGDIALERLPEGEQASAQ